jgi:hypothetical protein
MPSGSEPLRSSFDDSAIMEQGQVRAELSQFGRNMQCWDRLGLAHVATDTSFTGSAFFQSVLH